MKIKIFDVNPFSHEFVRCLRAWRYEMKYKKPYPNRYYGKKLIKNPGRIVELAEQGVDIFIMINSRLRRLPAIQVREWTLTSVAININSKRLYEANQKNQSTKSKRKR